MSRIMRDDNVLENMITKDSLLMRACILQAKWNNTTVEEEYRKTVAYKKRYKLPKPEDNNHEAWEFATNKIEEAPILLKNEREACIYHNKYIKNKKYCCAGNRCDKNCPNCVRR